MAQDLMSTRNDPYAAHGARASQEGQFLSFSKGEYVYGQNKDELPIGTRLVANMPGLRIGWRFWSGGKVVNDRTELVSDGRPEERRADLGDLDTATWERDNEGVPRDPWVLTNILELADPEKGLAFLYSTTSSGGRRAVGRLCTEYAREYRMRDGMLPIIELGRDSYMHKNREYGKIYNPVLKIIGWTDESDPKVSDAGGQVAGQRAADPTFARLGVAAPNQKDTATASTTIFPSTISREVVVAPASTTIFPSKPKF